MALESVKFFIDLKNQMGDEIITNISSELKYEFHQARKVVFEMNESATKFYLILKYFLGNLLYC
jgi:hypothetical protein